MRSRKWLLIVVVVALAAWWWARDRANRSTDVAQARREVEADHAAPRVSESSVIPSERVAAPTNSAPAAVAAAEPIETDDDESIRGLVTLPDGTPPPVEITVVAWPEALGENDYGPNVRELAVRVLSGDRNVPQARTASNGTFTISHLRRDAAYLLAAGAPGFITKDYPARATAGGAEVTLVVQPVYAALVRFVDAQTHGPVHVSSRIKVVDQVSAWMVDANPQYVITAGCDSVLAGLGADLFANDQNLRRHIQLCTDDSAPAHVGPFRIRVDLPGYEQPELEFFAEPLALGLHEVELALVPSASQRGELAIHWKGVPDTMRLSVRPILPWSTVTLKSSDERRPIEFVIDDLSEPELVLDEIPCGDYDVWITLQRVAIEPVRSLRIGATREVIEVDVSQFGALAFDVHHADGSAYTGVFGAYLGAASGKGHNLVAFQGPPYVVLGLKPQSWRASAAKPMAPDSDQLVEVKAGELTTLKFVVP